MRKKRTSNALKGIASCMTVHGLYVPAEMLPRIHRTVK